MMEKRRKIICFDWNFTLCNDLFFGQIDPGSEQFLRLEKALFKSEDSAKIMADWMRGRIDYKEVLKGVAQRAEIDPRQVEEMFIVGCKRMRFALPDMPEIVSRLRETNQVYVATDNMDSFTLFTAPSLRLYEIFDGVLNSADKGVLKGDFSADGKSLFFGEFLKERGCAPADLTLIDDAQPNEPMASYRINYVKIEPKTGLRAALSSLPW